MDEITNIPSHDFSANGKLFRYDFNLLNVEQAELAREAGNFKSNQMDVEPDSFKQVLKSRGADFLSIIMSYLLLEVKNDVVQAFNRDKAEGEIETFIRNLPVSELSNLRACMNDFFTNVGSQSVGLKLLTNEKRLDPMHILSTLMNMNSKAT